MKGLFVFDLRNMDTWSRRSWTSGTDHMMPFTKFARMTAISISCDRIRRRQMGLGIWCRSGKCHDSPELEELMVVNGCEFRNFLSRRGAVNPPPAA